MNFTGWGGGGISPSGTGVFAWAYSNIGVDDPSDPESTFQEHTDCMPHHLHRWRKKELTREANHLFSWVLRHQLP